MSIKLIKQIRDKTGASISDCKKALKESGGDMEKACLLASRLLKKQENKEIQDELFQSKEEAEKQLKYDFNHLIELLDPGDIRYSLWKLVDYLRGRYDLGLSAEVKKKYGLQSQILTPLHKIDTEITAPFINHCNNVKSKLLELSSGPAYDKKIKSLEKSITSELEELNIAVKEMSCLLFTPMLWSTTTDLSEGYKIEILQINSVSELIDGALNGFMGGYDETIRVTKNGVNLDELYETSNGTFRIENESVEGESDVYVLSEKMSNTKIGVFDSFGVVGDWIQIIDGDELIDIQSAKQKTFQDSWDYFKIIDLFIKKIS